MVGGGRRAGRGMPLRPNRPRYLHLRAPAVPTVVVVQIKPKQRIAAPVMRVAGQ